MTEKAKADIVERLRERYNYDQRYYPPAEKIVMEAANEIERLREALDIANDVLSRAISTDLMRSRRKP